MAEIMPLRPGPPAGDEARAICREALALAQRAEAAGLGAAAFLLDMAAMTMSDELGFLTCRSRQGDDL